MRKQVFTSLFLGVIAFLPSAILAKNTNFYLSNYFQTNLKDRSISEHNSSATFSLVGTYSLTNFGTLKVSTSVNKSLIGERKAVLGNTVLGLTKGLGSLDDEKISVRSSTSLIFPTSEYSKEIDQLYVGFSQSISFSRSVNSLLGPFNLSFSPKINYNFHQHKTKLTGGSNYQYIFSNSIGLSRSITDKLSLSISGVYQKLFTYESNSVESYYLGQSISYTINNFSSLTIGHNLGGSLIAANGSDLNIELFNKDDSSVYFDVTLSY